MDKVPLAGTRSLGGGSIRHYTVASAYQAIEISSNASEAGSADIGDCRYADIVDIFIQ